MQYGLYLSASGVLTSMHRQDVLSNNLANIETAGFKPDAVVDRARLVERLENPSAGAPPQLLLEQLGGGHLVAPTRPVLEQGALEGTGNPLDLAFEGRGFFALSREPGDDDALRLTRDGRFALDRRNTLVSVAAGLHVLDVDGKPIELSGDGAVHVDADGVIRQDGSEVARLQLLDVPSEELHKEGDGLFRTSARPDGRTPAPGSIRQGYVEASAVDPVLTLTRLMDAAKAVEANAKLMQYHDFIMGQAINTFGRVA